MAFAGEDLRMAELALEDSLYNQVCFHAHQAVEKSLKSLLSHAGDVPPRTHKLTDLLRLLEAQVPSLRAFAADLSSLEAYYIPTRYPDALPGSLDEGLPGRREAEEALDIANKISQAARATIEPNR